MRTVPPPGPLPLKIPARQRGGIVHWIFETLPAYAPLLDATRTARLRRGCGQPQTKVRMAFMNSLKCSRFPAPLQAVPFLARFSFRDLARVVVERENIGAQFGRRIAFFVGEFFQ